MRRLTIFLTLLILPAFNLPAQTNTVDPALKRLKSAVNAQVAAAKKSAPALGVSIVELDTAQPVYTYNADTQRILASNTKLLTSAAALDRLGPGFQFETDVILRGEIRDGVLEGDLAVIGGGDPTFSGRDHFGDSYGAFRPWAARLREMGIERIRGRLFVVHGLFDDERVHPTWPKDQLDRWYEAPVDALSFNDNCVLVKVKPDGKPGTPAIVELTPPLSMFRIEGNPVTIPWQQRQWVSIGRRKGSESHVFTASGKISSRAGSIDKWVTVTDPPRYFGEALHAALAEEGIPVDGPVVPTVGLDNHSAGTWKRLLTHRTDLLTVLEIVNKRSQNFYAESVFKLLGARFCNDGSWAGGQRAVSEFLTEIGLDPNSYKIADGSGMSRGNRMTARQITTLLDEMYHHRWGPEYLRTLPYSGEEDLRWHKRLVRQPYLGNVMAKTGYLNGVSTLSGYAKARSGKIYAFSILCNSIRSKSAAESAQDRIVRALIDNG